MRFTADASMFLFVQKGELQHIWQDAYINDIEGSFDAMRTYLPTNVSRILDIGGGMSGISVPLCRAYPGAVVTIMDGSDDAPRMLRQDKTFSSRAAAREFLAANNTPCDFEVKGKYDLVLSLRAWCFHIPIDDYLQTVMTHTYNTSRLIVDVRVGTPPPFKVLAVVSENSKCQRLAMSATRK